MPPPDYLPDHPDRETWDVIVVGTGMGGGTVGYELARLGRRVLFIEKGKFLHSGAGLHPGSPGESLEETRLRTGHWPLPLQGVTSFGQVEFFAPMGCGSGGSTTLFGAQLERFAPVDFRPRANFPNVPGADLPEQWPITYEELVPYYRRAEDHYRVCGEQDPLNPDSQASLREPPPLSERDEAIRVSLVGLGLHPYRSHVGWHQAPPCMECIDFFCPKSCKSDAGTRSLLPALTQHGARLLPECSVLELVTTRSRVTAVRADRHGREIRLTAKVVVLGAGAFATPLLLLNSRTPGWRDGLANRSGLVGRNLMLHTSDFITIDPGEQYSGAGPRKSLSLNDFYIDEGKKLGTFQAVGVPLLPAAILSYLRNAESRDPRWWRKPVSRHLPLVAELAARLFRRASLFSTIVEDLPYHQNRVLPDPTARNGWRFEYTYSRDLHDRNRHFRKRIVETLSPRDRVRVVTGGRNNINYGHACGTCRFGADPQTSVLDRTNRAHDLDNLYVVDASFFPSSGGINPSLTIAANALRVAGVIDGQLA